MKNHQVFSKCFLLLLCFCLGFTFFLLLDILDASEIAQPKKQIEIAEKAAEPEKRIAQDYIDIGHRYSNAAMNYGGKREFQKANEAYQKAIDAYQEAIRLEPENPYIYRYLAGTYSNYGQKKQAIETIQKAIKLKPDESSFYYSLGLSYYYSDYPDKYNKAIIALKKALDLKPDYPNALFQLGLSYLKLKNFKAASKESKILQDMDDEDAVEKGEFLEKLIKDTLRKK
ncbi:MAG: tetratricopeptide repeat protein [Candidatus Euphemobacter frigidus]|nr:tetratricopeptide repeat protein [Candidatus Euphemobacter frigidus]MDP8274961.1 tetratricopeptide repeat protein [Candidatus Euphemobacter frigidus]